MSAGVAGAEPLAAVLDAALERLALPAGRWLVAVSGGPDSVALLHLLARRTPAPSLAVAHVDHGIHPESAAVAGAVREFARALGLPFHLATLRLGPGCTETRARRARHDALAALAREAGARVILLAHTADDQAETVLMRLLAGSGPAGLAGIAPRRGRLARPLLEVSRAAIEAYVARHALPVWRDPANADPAHRRSWLRQVVLPLLRRELPQVDRRLAAAAAQAATAREAWDRLLATDARLALADGPGGTSVALPALAQLDDAIAAQLILALCRRAGVVTGPARVARVLAALHDGTRSRRVPLGGTAEAECSAGRLTIRARPASPEPSLRLDDDRAECRWGAWRFRRALGTAEPAPRAGWSIWVTPGPLAVRALRPGDRVQPAGFGGHRRVTRLLQEAKVPVGARRAWPVVVDGADDDLIVWVPGVCRAAHRFPPAGTEAWRLDVSEALES